jgi:hypothetical protein
VLRWVVWLRRLLHPRIIILAINCACQSIYNQSTPISSFSSSEESKDTSPLERNSPSKSSSSCARSREDFRLPLQRYWVRKNGSKGASWWMLLLYLREWWRRNGAEGCTSLQVRVLDSLRLGYMFSFPSYSIIWHPFSHNCLYSTGSMGSIYW